MQSLIVWPVYRVAVGFSGPADNSSSRELHILNTEFIAAPPAGLFGWVETRVDIDALFHAERQPRTLMRINFATTQDAWFWAVFDRIRAD